MKVLNEDIKFWKMKEEYYSESQKCEEIRE